MEEAKRCAIFGNIYQAKTYEAVQKLFDVLKSLGILPLIDSPFLEYLEDEMKISLPEHRVINDDVFDADIAISMGGDGTFLTTAMRVGDKQIPILGINTGRLGFLADFSLDDISQTLKDFLSGKLQTERCNVLQVECSEGAMCVIKVFSSLQHHLGSCAAVEADYIYSRRECCCVYRCSCSTGADRLCCYHTTCSVVERDSLACRRCGEYRHQSVTLAM